MSVLCKEDIVIYNFNSNSSHDKYRYYNCYSDYKCISCKEINSPSLISFENKDINKKSKLIYINKYFPKIFDKLFIYYDFLPDKIMIK